MTAALDQQSSVAPAEHVAGELVSVIEPDGVGAQQPTHSRHQVPLGRFHHQIKVIAHEAIGMHLPKSARKEGKDVGPGFASARAGG